MHLEQFLRRFESVFRDRSAYQISVGAPLGIIAEAEVRLEVAFPEPVRRFYEACNGIQVDEPALKVLPVTDLHRNGSLIVFCICNHAHRIAFRLDELNPSGQWSIVDAETDYEITLSMASFWSIHLWHWLIDRRMIWRDYWIDETGRQSGGAIDAST